MNEDEAIERYISERSSVKATTTPEQLRAFSKGYEAGQRAERERILQKMDAGVLQGRHISTMYTVMNELRADPAESGE